MKAHSLTHFKNENMFFAKAFIFSCIQWKQIDQSKLHKAKLFEKKDPYHNKLIEFYEQQYQSILRAELTTLEKSLCA